MQEGQKILHDVTWRSRLRSGQSQTLSSLHQLHGLEDPLEEGMATHSSIFVWKIPMDREIWQATVHRVAKSQTPLK